MTRAITTHDVKTRYDAYMLLKDASDDLLEQCYADPDNDNLDDLADRAYEAMWSALDDLADALAHLTAGQLDRQTVRRMATCPKYRDRFEDLMNRLAA